MAVLFANVPLAFALGACAESPKLEIPEGGYGGDGVVTAPGATCAGGGVVCGAGNAGCCPDGYACEAGGCVPATCTTGANCSGDSTCGGSKCKPWSEYPAGLARNLDCRTGVDLPSLKPVVQCHWPETPPSEFPDSVQVVGTPMVIDFNFDDNPATHHPSIVFVSYTGNLSDYDGVIRVIDGQTCELQATIDGEDNPFVPEISPALGDINRDGRPDIVAVDVNGRASIGQKTGVAVFTPVGRGSTDFKLLARQNSSLTRFFKGLSIHDVADDNDVPEILTDTGIYAFASTPMIGIPEKSNQEGSALEPPLVRDVNGDTVPEMITATGITYWNSDTQKVADMQARQQPLWNEDQSVPDAAFVGMADLGDFRTALGTDSVEMVIVSTDELLVTQVDGRVLLRVTGRGVAAGPPVIADFDGDGRMEFASPGRDTITAYDLDCADDDELAPVASNCKNPDGPNPNAILWQRAAHGAQSGASVFDFDGDGRSEVVYADQCFMRIFNGLNGDVLFSVPRSSITRWEYPVIADVDGDFHTEIVTSSNDANVGILGCPPTDPLLSERVDFEATHGVTVWSDPPPKRWAGSRMIWNEHSYSVTNVNDDGSIPEIRTVPSQFTSSEQDPNTLRQNVQGTTGISLQLADLTTWVDPVPKCQGQQSVAQISVSLCNRGLLDLPASSVNMSMLRMGAPNALCTKGNTKALRSGGCETITCDVQVPDSAPGFDIMVMGDSTNAVQECAEGTNNMAVMRGVFCIPVAR